MPSGSVLFATEEMKERLIIQVQKYECLYNTSLDSYRIKTARRNAWESVATNCGIPDKVKDCKACWKNLKEKFKREREKVLQSRSGDAGRTIKVWSLYEVLRFMEPFFKTRSTSSNFVLDKAPLPRALAAYQQMDEDATQPSVFQTGGNTQGIEGEDPKLLELVSGSSILNEDQDTSTTESPELAVQSCTSVVNSSFEGDDSQPELLGSSSSKRSTGRRAGPSKKRKLHHANSHTDCLIAAIRENNSSQCAGDHEDSTGYFFKFVAGEVRRMPAAKRLKFQAEVMKLVMAYQDGV